MDKRWRQLSDYRLEQAERCIKSARILVADNDCKGAANRSYYAIFHCMRSVLALEGVDFSKHSGVSAYFRKQYIKSGIFDVELSDIISEAFDIRSDSDYDDYYVLSREDVKEQIENAEKFYQATEKYLRGKDNE
ncbi:MAG: HEPN domain-containing protein [Roseburia sp.]|nr:HEPN domain-containing protein [Roseburia sp.]